jgi:hypothetical protein
LARVGGMGGGMGGELSQGGHYARQLKSVWRGASCICRVWLHVRGGMCEVLRDEWSEGLPLRGAVDVLRGVLSVGLGAGGGGVADIEVEAEGLSGALSVQHATGVYLANDRKVDLEGAAHA